MPVWPETLPQSPLNDGYSETMGNSVLRSDMDTGVAKTRRRTSASVRTMSARYILTADQAAALTVFFDVTVAGGSLPFTFPHPRTLADENARFTQPPLLRALAGGYVMAEIAMELLP